MKATGIWQPYSSLIALLEKRIETRHWAAPAWLIGQRVAIHATLGTGPGGDRAYRELINSEPFRSVLASHGFNDETRRGLHEADVPVISTNALPRGALVATAVLGSCEQMYPHGIDVLRREQPNEYAFGDHRTGRYAWHLTDVKPLTAPIPFKGRQGIFDVPDEMFERQGGPTR